MKSFLYVLMAVLILSPAAFAETTEGQAGGDTQCAALFAECATYADVERMSCLFGASTHPFCEGTELGALGYQRWVLSPVNAGGATAPGFLGNQVVDKTCLSKFDATFNDAVKKPSIAADEVRQLTASLEECKRDIPAELQRQ